MLTQYDYDPLGRRIAKHTEQGQIDFIWDGNQLLGECLNGQYTWYINRPDEFHPVALIKQDGLYYYHLDQLNTPRFVTNQNADVVWENTANAYGYEDSSLEKQSSLEKYNQAQTDFYQPIRFQGQYFDQESGFHYNRFRYYCPKQQRFIHQDPIGIVGGINHYQYAPNPVNWVDPMGLSCKEESGGWGFGIMDAIHTALDAAGMVPILGIVPDLINAGIYTVEGDMINASLSGAAAIPLVGQAATAGKYGAKVVEAVSSTASSAAKATKTVAKRKTPDDFPDFKGKNHKKAAAGEYNAHQAMVEKGYKPLGKTDGNYKPGETGIDGIYHHAGPPPKTVITEAKYGSARLGNTKSGKQMSDDWVTDKRLQNAGLNESERRKILKGLEKGSGTVEKLLIRNKPDGSLVVKTLDKDAKVIGKTLGF